MVTDRAFSFGLIFVLALAGIDVAAKYWAVTSAPLADNVRLSPLLSLALHKNPGIAFDIPVPFFIILPVSTIICVTFIYFAIKAFPHAKLTSLSALTVVIGALGNLIDRAVNEFTTDYLIFFKTSAINISDILIVVGMIGFLWYHKEDPSPETSA